MQEVDIKNISITDIRYPKCFTELAKPPKSIFAAGNTALLAKKPTLGVIGTRRITPYGREVTRKLTKSAAASGAIIVSGMAYGVDSVAHEAALDAGGATIAVLPGSLQNIYPANHWRNAMRILDGDGLLLTEYGLPEPPMKYQFIDRNRLIAALSDVLLVTEASLKSGTNHTVQFAMELGKTICAVPGNITSPMSMGVNQLFRDGAIPVFTPSDLHIALGINEALTKPAYEPKNPVQTHIIESLSKYESLSAASILASSSINDPGWLNTELTMLELAGVIKNTHGKWRLHNETC